MTAASPLSEPPTHSRRKWRASALPGVCLLTCLETPECRAWKCVKIIRKRKMGAEEGIKIKDTGQKIKGRRTNAWKSRGEEGERTRGNTRFERGKRMVAQEEETRKQREKKRKNVELALGRKAGINRGRKRERERGRHNAASNPVASLTNARLLISH